MFDAEQKCTFDGAFRRTEIVLFGWHVLNRKLYPVKRSFCRDRFRATRAGVPLVCRLLYSTVVQAGVLLGVNGVFAANIL